MALTDEDKAWISSTMVGLLAPTNSRLEAIDTRLDRMDTRLDGIDTRLYRLDTRLDGIDTRLDRMDTRLETIDDRLIATNDRLDASTARLTNFMLEMRTEIIRRLDSIDQRLEFLGSSVLNMESRFPPVTKAIVDFGVLAGQLSRDQMQARERDADLASRVARLEDQMSKLINRAA
jgi:chromosome segregation ATPase